MEESLVQSLSSTSVLDWFSVIAPIILSVVAICISISTAHKQNKIALFEKKYKVYINLKQILKSKAYFRLKQLPPGMILAEGIRNGIIGGVLNIDDNSEKARTVLWVKELNNIQQIAESSIFLFKKENATAIIAIHKETNSAIERLLIEMKTDFESTIKKINAFEQEFLPSIENELFL